MSAFVYLPGIDRVLFLNHIDQIEVFRDGNVIEGLGVYTPSKPCMIKNRQDIEILSTYFNIPFCKND